MGSRISREHQAELGRNCPLFACPIFPSYFGLNFKAGIEHTQGLQRFFTGNIRRVFHNIYTAYESISLSIYQSGRVRLKPFAQWIGA